MRRESAYVLAPDDIHAFGRGAQRFLIEQRFVCGCAATFTHDGSNQLGRALAALFVVKLVAGLRFSHRSITETGQSNLSTDVAVIVPFRVAKVETQRLVFVIGFAIPSFFTRAVDEHESPAFCLRADG